nr:FtsX-like permease family protein [uncultured Desulfobacter sp.]
MKLLQICFRNIFRNTRRSVMTIMAITIGTVGILSFGGYFFSTMFGMEASYVRMLGHLQIYKTGFFEYGAGNPGDYGIYDYKTLMKTIAGDDFFKDKINVITPVLQFSGIIGNYDEEVSKTFFGSGVIPSDQKVLGAWRGRHILYNVSSDTGLNDDDITGGVIGVGMARILNLCDDLKIDGCRVRDKAKVKSIDEPMEDFSAIAALDAEAPAARDLADSRPQLDLLATQVGGAPNVVRMGVNQAKRLPIKQLDDNYVTVHLKKAQQLVYGNAKKPGVTGIIIQLKSTDDLTGALARLEEMFRQKGLDLEVKRFETLAPYYGQVKSFIGSIFIFMSVIMLVVVLFTVMNTMSMCVMERVNEIGTIRSMGVRRGGVIKQFMIEGGLLGLIGGTMGVVIAFIFQYAVNLSNITYIPPGNVEPVPFAIQILGKPGFMPSAWMGFILMSVLSSYISARKAGRMQIVDALGHY